MGLRGAKTIRSYWRGRHSACYVVFGVRGICKGDWGVMDREELAARIYASWANSKYNAIGPKKSFRLADRFIREAKRQAAKDAAAPSTDHDCDSYKCTHWSHSYPEPPKPCEHEWVDYLGRPGTLWCGKCRTSKPKPKREPREWWIHMGRVFPQEECVESCLSLCRPCRVREVLD